jgi:hypothetical protein
MRLPRVLVVATSVAALLAQPSAAQDGRPFHDAWFWGVKGGISVYSTNYGSGSAPSPAPPGADYGTDNGVAPMVGLDWMITRTRGGLYVSFDQAFFKQEGSFKETSATGLVDRVVSLNNLQRIQIAMVGFPLQSPTLHPYIGIGAGMYRVGSVGYLTPFSGSSQASVAADSVAAKKVSFSPFVLAGAQKRLPMFSVFAQGTASWLQRSFFLHYEPPKRSLALSLEAGIRYNIGSSIDRER